jgi:hypothetical protein
MAKAKTEKPKFTSDQLVALLRQKYCLPKYAFVEQVPNGTTTNRSRVADALAMGCWRDKRVNIELNGFEIKISRADWRNELNDLNKSAAFQMHCHRWWIVATPGIVDLAEMPAEWGLLEPRGGGLVVRKAASLRTPEPVSFAFLAAIMRRCVQADPSTRQINDAREQGYQNGLKQGRSLNRMQLEQKLDLEKRNRERLQQTVDEFQEQSGLDIRRYNGAKIGAAVRALEQLQGASITNQLNLIRMISGEAMASLQTLETHFQQLGDITSTKGE